MLLFLVGGRFSFELFESLKHKFNSKSEFLDLFIGILEVSFKVSDLVIGSEGRFLRPEGSRFGYV